MHDKETNIHTNICLSILLTKKNNKIKYNKLINGHLLYKDIFPLKISYAITYLL